MNVIPAHLKEARPIFVHHKGFLVVGYGCDVFVHWQKGESRGLVASFRVNSKTPIQRLCVNESPIASDVIVAVLSESEVNIVSVGSGEKAVVRVVAQHFFWDCLSPASFFVVTPQNQMQRFTLNEETRVWGCEWAITVPEKIKDAKFSEYDPHYFLMMTRTDDLFLMERSSVSGELKNVWCLNWFSGNEAPVCVFSLCSEFFGVVTACRIYLCGIRSRCFFAMVSAESPIVGAFPVKGLLPAVVAIHGNGRVQCYAYNKDYECVKAQGMDVSGEVQFVGSCDDAFYLKSEFSVLECYLKDDEMGIGKVTEWQTCDASQPVTMCGNRMAFVNGHGTLMVIDITTFRILMQVNNIEKISDMKFFSENALIIQVGKKLRVLDASDSETKIVDIDVDSVASFQVCLSRMITVATTDKVLVNVNEKFVADNEHTRQIKGLLAFACGIHPKTDEFVVTVSIYGDGIRHYNQQLEEIEGYLKLSGRLEYYTDVVMTGPFIVLFSNYGRIIRIDLRTYDLKGPFNEERMLTAIPLPDGKLCFTTQEHVIQLNNQFVVCLKLPIGDSKIVGFVGKTFYVVYQHSIVALTNEKRPSLVGDLEIPDVSVDNIMKAVTETIQLLIHLSQTGDDIDDLCMLLDIKHEPLDSKDFRQLYHRNFLSFLGAEIPEPKKACLIDFAKKFAEAGNFLTAASIMHIIGETEKCVSYLCESKRYFDIAVLYAKRVGNSGLQDKVIDQYVGHLLRAGETVRAVAIHMSERTHNKAESMKFALNYRNEM